MGPIVSVIVAILLHGVAQSGWPEWIFRGGFVGPALFSMEGGALALGMGTAGCLLPYWAARRASRAARRGQLVSGQRFQTLAENAGWISYGLLLFGGRWIQVVRGWTGASLELDDWPEAALALSFAPFLLYQLLAIDASVRAGGGTPRTQRHLRAFQSRMFLACLAPIAVFVAASVALGQSDWLKVQVEHVGLASVLFTGLMVLVLAQILPALLRWSWDTVPFPEGPQRERLDEVARAASFEPRDIRIWRTGDLMANAAIVGFRARGRTVLFSDQLLTLLNTRELCAVYAHEIGHARRGHVTVFLAWTLGFLFLGDAAVRHLGEAHGLVPGAAAGIFAVALWFFSFGWLSRRFELDADLFSLHTVNDLPALVSALERVGGPSRETSGWRHFGVGPRVRFLARAVGDGAFVARFRNKLRVLTWVGAGLAVLGSGVQLLDLLDTLPRDRAVASLARGHFSRAETLAQDLPGEDGEELRALAALAGRIGGGATPAVEAALAEALGGQDPSVARDLAVIASLRGVSGATAVAHALDYLVEGDRGAALAALASVDERWRQDLERMLAATH